jgi:hypothetical protein
MSNANAVWREEIRRRFADRPDVGDAVYERFFSREKLPLQDVREALELLASEFDVPAGLLRPNDPMTLFSDPIRPRGIWQWMAFQVRSGDSQLAVMDRLAKRLGPSAREQLTNIQTVGDFVRAWCGTMSQHSRSSDRAAV